MTIICYLSLSPFYVHLHDLLLCVDGVFQSAHWRFQLFIPLEIKGHKQKDKLIVNSSHKLGK